ncbi:hypothetical protein BT69DRAFT_334875 [Atractiella rhizophila]|nr:hypothetical protein BT69DRAFT_334875 [Atractiella rhizophila]
MTLLQVENVNTAPDNRNLFPEAAGSPEAAKILAYWRVVLRENGEGKVDAVNLLNMERNLEVLLTCPHDGFSELPSGSLGSKGFFLYRFDVVYSLLNFWSPNLSDSHAILIGRMKTQWWEEEENVRQWYNNVDFWIWAHRFREPRYHTPPPAPLPVIREAEGGASNGERHRRKRQKKNSA